MADLSIRNLDEGVREKLRLRAARNGRSVEAEIRAILGEAVAEKQYPQGFLLTILDRFQALGGVEVELPERSARPRAADLST